MAVRKRPRFELYPDAGNGHFRPFGIARRQMPECGRPGARMRRQMAPMRIWADAGMTGDLMTHPKKKRYPVRAAP